MGMNICSSCGAKAEDGAKFCTVCGKSLSASPAPPAVPRGVVAPGAFPRHMGKAAQVDPSLKMLAEYCRKTVATVGGDGHTEWVLYQCPDGALQLHYFENYMGYEEEIHKIRPASADTWEKILAVRDKYNLQPLPANRSMGMCGGYSVLKICDGENNLRIVTGMLTKEESQAFGEISAIITGCAEKE